MFKILKRNLVMFLITSCLMCMVFGCSDDENPIIDTNNAPTKPQINTPSGSPSNSSTNQSITPTLSWKCSDPENDNLKYDVYFGTNSTPPIVSENRISVSYSPGTLQYSKRYYWKIIAQDSKGAKTSSDVWSFTTKAQLVETVSMPNKPTGVDSGLVNQSLSFSTGGSSSSQSHSIQYKFDWGDGNYSGWSSTSSSHAWANSGTYNVKAQARCVTHTNIISSWSSSKSVKISDIIKEPILSISSNNLDFGTTSTNKTFTITNSGEETLNWDITDNQSWIIVNTISGSTTTEADEITVSINRNSLSVGTHSGNVIVSSNGGDKSVQVTIEVPHTNSPPYLVASTTSLDFGTALTNKTFTISNSGEETLNWNISDNQSWISINPVSGNTNTEADQVSVSINRNGLSDANYSGVVTLSSNGGNKTISVTMQVYTPPCDYHVSRPSSSDEWRIGSSKTIKWDSENAGSYVKIELYKGSSNQGLINSSTYNDGTYTWIVDDYNNGTDDNYRIKVTDLDDGSCYDYSSYFDIDAGPWTVSCNLLADADIASCYPNTNYGTRRDLDVGIVNGCKYASFLKFDLSSIPKNATITSATLHLYAEFHYYEFTMKIFIARDSWQESSITWSNSPYFYNSPVISWKFYGSDFGMNLIIPVEDHLKRWIEQGYSNNGFVLACSPYPTDKGNVKFRYKEPSNSNSPKLSVTYTLE